MSRAEPTDYRYAAFASYSTDPDYQLVRRTESFLEAFHRLPTTSEVRLRKLDICVDGSDFVRARRKNREQDADALRVENLQDIVIRHLEQCEHLLLFCSRNANNSQFVKFEVDWWLEHREADSIHLIVTEGVDPGKYPAEVFPKAIVVRGLAERPWCDFRGARRLAERKHWKKVRDYEDARIKLASDLMQQDVSAIQPLWFREVRRRRRNWVLIATAASIVLLMLAILAGSQWQAAAAARVRAAQLARRSQSQSLAELSGQVRDLQPTASLLLAVESIRQVQDFGEPVPLEAEQALRDSFLLCRGEGLATHSRPVDKALFSDSGRWLVTSGSGQAYLWDIHDEASPTPLPLWRDWEGFWKFAFSPHDTWLASSGSYASGHLWNLAAYAETGEMPPPLSLSGAVDVDQGHLRSIEAMVFSDDERLLTTAGGDNAIYRWDLSQPGHLTSRYAGMHDSSINCVAVSKEADFWASGTDDKRVFVWKMLDDGQSGYWELKDHRDRIVFVGFHHQSERLVSVGSDGEAFMWDWDSSNPPILISQSRSGAWVTSVALSSDESWLAIGRSGGEVEIWHLDRTLESGQPVVKSYPRGHSDEVYHLRFSPDNRRLVSGGKDQRVVTWNLLASEEFFVRMGGVHTGLDDEPAAVGFSTRGENVLAVSKTLSVRKWRLPESSISPIVLRPTDLTYIHTAAISENGRWLAATGIDNRIHLWDLRLEDPRLGHRVLNGHDGEIRQLDFGKQGTLLISGGDDGSVLLWSINSQGTENAPYRVLAKADESVTRVRVNSHYAVVGRYDGSISAWSVSGSEPEALGSLEGHDGLIRAMHLDDGRTLITGSDDKTAMVWNLEDSPPSRVVVLQGHDVSVNAVALGGPNGDLVFSADGAGLDAGAVRVWRLDSSGGATHLWNLEGASLGYETIALSGDRRWIVGGALDGTVNLWDLNAANPERSALPLRGHTGRVWTAAFSPDSSQLITASGSPPMDQIGSAEGYIHARVWKLADLKTPPILLRGANEREIAQVMFSGDGRWIITVGLDEIALWHRSIDDLVSIAGNCAGRNLSQAEWEEFFTAEPYRRILVDVPKPQDIDGPAVLTSPLTRARRILGQGPPAGGETK